VRPDAATPGRPGPASRPLRREGAAAVELDDNMALYDDVGQLLIMLNSSASVIWECCDGTMTVDDMVRELTATHPDDAAVIGEDVRQTVRKLLELGLVVDAEE
jgi:Coenzyme PQQ synthesis protein D (PqqD)